MLANLGEMAVLFLSTLPARGATLALRFRLLFGHISIHAPREGSDYGRRFFAVRCVISIHAPREGSDDALPVTIKQKFGFLSTLPARGATSKSEMVPSSLLFLSTLPARGATTAATTWQTAATVFLSTLPARGATSIPPPARCR